MTPRTEQGRLALARMTQEMCIPAVIYGHAQGGKPYVKERGHHGQRGAVHMSISA